jgi:hypothetical protein
MRKETVIVKLDRALKVAAQQALRGEQEGYVGLDRVLQHLHRMKAEVERDDSTGDSGGVGRQVVDQWPFSEVTEAVLEAVQAYEGFS